MPLFEISKDELVPFRRLKGGADLFEKEIEDLLWANLEEFTGEALFPVKQQAKLPSGGIPDIVALDKTGRVVVFEVKRDVDRRQLAQCLEYAGWARTTNLDELAGLYHGSQKSFWSDWQDFTDSATPVVVNSNPRLFLVARDFQDRTELAFDFLIENKVPVTLVRVTVYVDKADRRFVDVEGDHEVALTDGGEQKEKTTDYTRIGGKPIKLADLLDAGILEEGEPLEWARPQKGEHYKAKVLPNGSIELEDGRKFSSPSRAAGEAADIPAVDGWTSWAAPRVGKKLHGLRRDLHDAVADAD